jgi:hypothetical protein
MEKGRGGGYPELPHLTERFTIICYGNNSCSLILTAVEMKSLNMIIYGTIIFKF